MTGGYVWNYLIGIIVWLLDFIKNRDSISARGTCCLALPSMSTYLNLTATYWAPNERTKTRYYFSCDILSTSSTDYSSCGFFGAFVSHIFTTPWTVRSSFYVSISAFTCLWWPTFSTKFCPCFYLLSASFAPCHCHILTPFLYYLNLYDSQISLLLVSNTSLSMHLLHSVSVYIVLSVCPRNPWMQFQGLFFEQGFFRILPIVV